MHASKNSIIGCFIIQHFNPSRGWVSHMQCWWTIQNQVKLFGNVKQLMWVECGHNIGTCSKRVYCKTGWQSNWNTNIVTIIHTDHNWSQYWVHSSPYTTLWYSRTCNPTSSVSIHANSIVHPALTFRYSLMNDLCAVTQLCTNNLLSMFYLINLCVKIQRLLLYSPFNMFYLLGTQVQGKLGLTELGPKTRTYLNPHRNIKASV